MQKKVLIVTFITLMLLFFIACSNTGSVKLIKIVPGNSNMLVWIDLAEIMKDGGVDDLYETLPDDPELKEIVEDALEIFDGLDEGLLFMDLSESSESEPYVGIIIRGKFVENDLVVKIEKAADKEMVNQVYKGYTIYSDELQDIGLAFIGADAFVLGTVNAVREVIDTKKGDAIGVNGEIVDTLNSLDKGSIKVAASIASDLFTDNSSNSDNKSGMFNNLVRMGMTYNGNQGIVVLRAKLYFTEENSAQESLKALKSSIGFITTLSDNEQAQELKNLMDKLNMTVDSNCLNIDVEATSEEIGNVINSFYLYRSVDLSDLWSNETSNDNSVEFDEEFFKNFEFSREHN